MTRLSRSYPGSSRDAAREGTSHGNAANGRGHVLSIVAFLGLAIAGAGGAARFFSYPPLTVVTLVTIVLGFAALFSEGHVGSGVKEDRSNRWVFGALSVLGLLDAYLPAYTDQIDFLTFGGQAIRWLGVVLYAAGGALRLAPVFVLGRRFSGLAFRSGVGVVIALLSLGVALACIQAEERLLSGTFAADYDAYRAGTSRLIPYIY